MKSKIKNQKFSLAPVRLNMTNFVNTVPDLKHFSSGESSPRQDLNFNFLSNQEQIMLNQGVDVKKGRRGANDHEDSAMGMNLSDGDSPEDLIYNSDDSVYESTYQVINKQQHPMLRAAKLTKRIRKDKNVTHAERKALKARRNIIMFRIRQKRHQNEEDLLLRTIPHLQNQVSQSAASWRLHYIFWLKWRISDSERLRCPRIVPSISIAPFPLFRPMINCCFCPS